MVRSGLVLRKSLLLIGILVSAVFCQLREQWYLFRVEVNATSHSEEIGGSAGIFWNLKELDQPPCDAFGVTAGITALLGYKETIPGARFGISANRGLLCARARYILYKSAKSSAVSVINPQIGLTYLSIVSLYVGYNKPLFNRTVPGLGEINVSFCMGMPTYCLRDE
jgi:hypothetical protein